MDDFTRSSPIEGRGKDSDEGVTVRQLGSVFDGLMVESEALPTCKGDKYRHLLRLSSDMDREPWIRGASSIVYKVFSWGFSKEQRIGSSKACTYYSALDSRSEMSKQLKINGI